MRVWFCLLVLSVSGCSSPAALGTDLDAGRLDAGSDAGAGDTGVDAPALDTGTDAPRADAPDAPAAVLDAGCNVAGTTTTWYELGHCFTAPNCCSNEECGAGFACNRLGHCVSAETWCGCVDGSCVPGAECLNNEVICGICVFPTTACTAPSDCPDGQRCENGHCFDPGERCVEPRTGPP